MRSPGMKAPNNQPMLSVIVPVYNSARVLERCLVALSASENADFEVLVVDDGSTDVIEPLVTAHGFKYLRLAGPGGPARARNRGAMIVRGKYVVFIDADVCVQHDTLSRFAARFAGAPEIDALIGSYDDAPDDPGFLSQYKNLFHHFVHQQADGPVSTFWSGCGAIRRDLFLEIGGFDEKKYRRPAIEDIELGTWLSAAGYRIVLDTRIRAKHLKRWTLVNLIKTDVFDRGIPWTRLMLRSGGVADTLNVKQTQRLSVALVYLTCAAVLLAATLQPGSAWVWVLATSLSFLVTLLNLDFYRFFYARKGFWFTLRIVSLHWLYFLYCGFSFAYGTIQHYLVGEREESPQRQAAQLKSQTPMS